MNGIAIFQPRELAVDARLSFSPRPVLNAGNFVAVDADYHLAMKESVLCSFS